MDELIIKTKQLSIDSHSYLNDIFKDSGFEVRTEGDINNPYFNGKDLCRVLGFKHGKEKIKTALKMYIYLSL